MTTAAKIIAGVLLIGAGFLLPASESRAVNRADLQGLYMLLRPDQRPETKAIDVPLAKGVSVRTSWARLQPRENGYEWSYLDQTVRTARLAGKKVILRILPGIRSPDWALAGVETIRHPVDKAGHPLQGRILAIPIPWDAAYLARWSAFVAAFGRRYNDDPSVVLIQMAGPTANTAEMHLAKTPADKTVWRAKGYSRDRLVRAWKVVIDAYAKAFPDKYLAIDIAVPVFNDGSLEEVLSYGIRTVPGRFCIQGNWLSDHTRKEFPLYRLIRDYSKTAPVGFQMLRASRSGSSGSLRAAVDRGIEAGARYFEIYATDFRDPDRSEDLRYAAERLARFE